MMDHRKLQEMIGACRPGSRDIDLPEMAPLAGQLVADSELSAQFERSQHLDARLARALDDVVVPAGLHDRILARVAAETPLSASCPAEDSIGVTANDSEVRPAPASRRRWLRSVAAVAAGLLVLVSLIATYAFWPRRVALTHEGLLNLSSRWYEQMRANPGWQPLASGQEIRDFPLPGAIRQRPRHWADVSTLVGRMACAYDLSVPGRSRATLFVITSEDRIAGSSPPLKPDSSTGGLMIGCWQSGEIVYVLAVEGSQREYEGLLYDAAPALAAL